MKHNHMYRKGLEGRTSEREQVVLLDEERGHGALVYQPTQYATYRGGDKQLESTQRALASIYDSERMGVATAEVTMYFDDDNR